MNDSMLVLNVARDVPTIGPVALPEPPVPVPVAGGPASPYYCEFIFGSEPGQPPAAIAIANQICFFIPSLSPRRTLRLERYHHIDANTASRSASACATH